MGLSTKHLKAFQGKRFYSSVLFENAPQLALQIYFLILLSSFDESTVIALLSSTVSMILSIVDIWSANRLVRVMKKQEKSGHDIISIEFRIDTESQAHDEVENYKRFFLGKPNALSKAIAETLIVHPRNIEIYQLIAAHPGIKVGFTVYSVNNDAHLMIDKLKDDLKKLQLLVSIKWKMKTYPNITNIVQGQRAREIVTLSTGPNGSEINDNEYSKEDMSASASKTKTRTRTMSVAEGERIDGNTRQTDEVPNMLPTTGGTQGRKRGMSKSTTYSLAASRRLVRISRMDSGLKKKLQQANLEYIEKGKLDGMLTDEDEDEDEDESSFSMNPDDLPLPLPMDVINGNDNKFDINQLWENFKSFRVGNKKKIQNPELRMNINTNTSSIGKARISDVDIQRASLSTTAGMMDNTLKFVAVNSESKSSTNNKTNARKKIVQFNLNMCEVTDLAAIPQMNENENKNGDDNGLIDDNEWNKYVENMEKLIQFHDEIEGKIMEEDGNDDDTNENDNIDDSEWLLTMENMKILLNVREQIRLNPEEFVNVRPTAKSITEYKEYDEDGIDIHDNDVNDDNDDDNDKVNINEYELASMIDEMNEIEMEDDDELQDMLQHRNTGSLISYDLKRISVKL